jgi:hypothetical protein
MAHYAFLDENNIVTEVITGVDETELIEGLDPETWYGNFRGQACKRTSYNTYDGKHLYDGTPFRKNYASIGGTYDTVRDAFLPPKPFNSWILNEDTCQWKPPTPYPSGDGTYQWVEDDLNWQLITP